jgi:uncharacterized membrane protein YbhN (UPF0104 family)
LSNSLLAHPIRRGRRSTLALIVFAVLLSSATLLAVAWAAGFDAVHDRLVHPSWTWVAVGLCGQVPALVGYALAVHGVAAVEGGPTLGLRRAWAVVAAGFGPFVLHGGGFAVDLHVLKTAGLDEREARSRTFGLGVLEYAVLAPVAFSISLLLLVTGFHKEGVPLSWAIGVPVGAVIALALVRHRKSFARRRGWRAKLARPLDGIAHTLDLVHDLRAGMLALIGMAVYWAADIFVLWACLAIFWPQGRPSVTLIILGYASGYALTRRSLPLAGAGAVETMLPFALMWTGIALPAAIVCVFVYRLFNLWLPLVPAAAAVFVLRRASPAAPA